MRKLEVDFDRLRGFGTQKITMQTFETLLEGVVHRQLINGIFNAFDDNGDGFVGLMEFVCGFSNLSKGPDAERLKCEFISLFLNRIYYSLILVLAKMLDEDRDGYLTIDDIQRLYKLINLVFM